MSGRYETSLIDGVEYCKSNGKFLLHIKAQGLSSYQEYYDKYIASPTICECGEPCAFDNKLINYKKTCNSRKCIGRLISEGKSKRTPEQEAERVVKFQTVMSKKTQSQKDDIQKRKNLNYFKKYGVQHRLQQQVNPESLSLLQDKNWMTTKHVDEEKTAVEIASILDVGITTATNWLHRHDITIRAFATSQGHRELVDYIKTLTTAEVLSNDRKTIAPMELDIVLPTNNLAIEYNGIYWHGELRGRDKQYHISKTNAANANGFRLIHINELEWVSKKDIVKSRLSSFLGFNERIYGRQTTITQVGSKTQAEFFNLSHIQGYCPASVAYALIYNKEIVSMMSFGKSRFSKQHEWELIRFANKLNTNVIGGASKLFKRFVSDQSPSSIITYSDVGWNTGNAYIHMGFNYKHRSAPGYQYFQTNNPLKLESRNKFQKHKLPTKLSSFDDTKTEWENMVNNGYDRLWNCGNDVFEWML
jgi:hypothetical protein